MVDVIRLTAGEAHGSTLRGQAVHMEGWDHVRVFCPTCNHLERMPWEGPLPILAAVDPVTTDAPMATGLNWRPLLPFVERFRGVLAERCTNLTDPLAAP